MMKKASAGILSFAVGVSVFLGGWMGVGGNVHAQRAPAEIPPPPAAAEAPAATAPEAPADPTPAAAPEFTYPEKLAALAGADVSELRKRLEEVETQIDEVNIAESNARVQAAREQAQTGSKEVKEIQAQIARLHAELRQAVDRNPAVVAAVAEADRTHEQLMDRLNFRTGLLRLIAEKERQSKWTEPTTAPQENNP